jgi:hypothetical protein
MPGGENDEDEVLRGYQSKTSDFDGFELEF